MMPKGVEHIEDLFGNDFLLAEVRIPMMPKGVEHAIAEFCLRVAKKSENSDDAERR